MSLELFPRGKEVECLSAWQISKLALDLDAPSLAAARLHSQMCATCASRVKGEAAECAAALSERVPSTLLSRAGTPPWRRRVRLPPVVLAALAGVLAVTLVARLAWMWWQTPPPVTPVRATISRDGAVLQDEVPLRQVGTLRAGDKIRLRLQHPTSSWVRLQAQQAGALWDVYYEGPVPQDGWLPTAFTVTLLSRMQLWLLACPDEATGQAAQGNGVPEGCVSERFDL